MEQEHGDGWAEGVHPDDLQRCVDIYLDHFGRRAIFEMEYRLRRYDGVYRWIFDRGAPFFDEQGVFQGFIGSCVDVQARREAEAARQGFLSHVAHELRTPLQAIRTYVEVMQRRAQRNEPISNDLARKLVAQIERFSVLVDQVDGVRFAGQPEGIALDNDACDLGEVLEAVWSRWAQGVGDRDELLLGSGHTLRRVVDGSPAPLRGDRARLEQALQSMVLNAIKFSPAGSEIAVRLEAAGGEQKLVVEDEGIGIPEAELDRVGEPFYRASNASNPRYPGIGLGLAIAKAIVIAHGGRLGVERASRGGTRVSMVMPTAPA